MQGGNAVGGQYDPQTGVITINPDAAIAEEMERRSIDLTQAEREVVADWVGKNLYKAGFVQAVVNADAAMGNTMLRAVDRLRLALGNKKSRSKTNLAVAERLFMRALEQEQMTREGGVEYAIRKDINGELFVEVEGDILTGKPESDIPKILSDIIQNKFHNLLYANGQRVVINQKTNREWRMSKSAQALRKNDPQAYADKLRSFNNADELLKASKGYIGEAIKHVRKDSFVEFARGTVNFRVATNGYSADIIVGTTKDGRAVLYDIINIAQKKITDAPNTSQIQNSTDRHDASATDTTIPQNGSGVNPYSMQDGENNSQKSIVNRPWLQGDTSVDMYGNPVEPPHTTRTASAQSAADKAFFDTVRRYLPDGGEHSSPRRFTSADLPIDSEPRKVYNISDKWLSETAKSRQYDVRAEVPIPATGQHSHDRYHSNKGFYLRMKNDPEFKREMDAFFGYDVMAYMKSCKRGYKNPSPDWEWHHPIFKIGEVDFSCYTMELVPKWQHHDKRYQPGFHINYYGGLAQMKHIQVERGTENENN